MSGTEALYTARAATQLNTITAGHWGPFPIPAACGPISQYSAIIYGTSGNDFIDADDFQPGGPQVKLSTPGITVIPLRGSNKQIILGGGGDDLIYSGNAKDCLVGGPGNDVLIAGNGPDILLGGDGNDTLIGGHAPDTLDGGPGGNQLVTGQASGDPCSRWPGTAQVRVSCHQKNGNGKWMFTVIPATSAPNLPQGDVAPPSSTAPPAGESPGGTP